MVSPDPSALHKKERFQPDQHGRGEASRLGQREMIRLPFINHHFSAKPQSSNTISPTTNNIKEDQASLDAAYAQPPASKDANTAKDVNTAKNTNTADNTSAASSNTNKS